MLQTLSLPCLNGNKAAVDTPLVMDVSDTAIWYCLLVFGFF